MKTPSKWVVPLLAVAAGATLVTGGPAGTAGAARTGTSLPLPARTAAAPALSNHRITGNERAISCLTAVRCVAVGRGVRDHRAGGQVVALVGGKQARVTVLHPASDLIAVSCPNAAGCWAMGVLSAGGANRVLVKIGPTGKVIKAVTVKVSASVLLASISCSKMISCELFSGTSSFEPADNLYVARWTGRKLRVHQVHAFGAPQYFPGNISCWQATCVAVGQYFGPGSTEVGGFTVTTRNGRLGKLIGVANQTIFSVSCISASTCYAPVFTNVPGMLNDGVYGVVTLHHGVPGNAQTEPTASGIACKGVTCWAPAGPGFLMITNGVPAASPVADPAISGAGIASRGHGFAAVGAAVGFGYWVSEVATG